MTQYYVVAAMSSSGDSVLYLAFDDDVGPYWTSVLKCAKIFTSYQVAIQAQKSIESEGRTFVKELVSKENPVTNIAVFRVRLAMESVPYKVDFNAEAECFKTTLLKQLGIYDHPKADILFQMSWDAEYAANGFDGVIKHAKKLKSLLC